LNWTPPDVEGLVEFLVRDKGFNEDRVRKGAEKMVKMVSAKQQGRLDGFFAKAPAKSPTKQPKESDKGKGTKRRNDDKKGSQSKKAKR